MTGSSPPSVPRSWLVGIGLLYALSVAYAILTAQILLGAVIPALLIGIGYVGWRLLTALETSADALRRIADCREREREQERDRY